MTIQWYGEVDLNKKGLPSSDFPARYHETLIDDLKEEISTIERDIDLDIYQGKKKVQMRELLALRKERYDAIMQSKPKFTDVERDKVAATVKKLGDKIGHMMFTREEKKQGTGDAHEEARRWQQPCVKVENETEADFFKQKGVSIVDGKVNRVQAEIAYKVMLKDLESGVVPDTERLRFAK